MTHFVGDGDGKLLGIAQSTIDDNVADIVLINAAKEQGRIFKANVEGLQGRARWRRRRETAEVDHRDVLPDRDRAIDGDKLGCCRVLSSAYFYTVARVVDDVDNLIVIRSDGSTACVKKKGESYN